jgi:hypothetical protein
MGALQPGIPYSLTKFFYVIDLKNCFFTIPLHRGQKQKSLPSPFLCLKIMLLINVITGKFCPQA